MTATDLDRARSGASQATPAPSRRSSRALDWFVFFVADVQTGFGPFVAVYLTASKWTQTDIGLVLTIGGLVSLLFQIPAGALVDAVRSTRMAAAISLVCIGLSALALAVWPIFPIVVASRIVQAGASCVLGVAMASLSLALVGRAGISLRLGRNAAFASLGTGLAAAGMGACGYYISNQAVFFVSAAIAVPGVIALAAMRRSDLRRIAPPGPAAKEPARGPSATLAGLWRLIRDPPLVTFAACIVLFQMANASMLPLAASMLTLRSSHAATAMVAAAIVVPQAIVAVLSPTVGRQAERWGRKPLLLIGFGALPLRGLLFALTSDPNVLVAVQMLDGISAAVLGVLVPLTISDIAGRSGRFNLAQGAVGCAVGIGAAISTTVFGFIADRLSSHLAFWAMSGVSALGFIITLLLMPETRALADDASRTRDL